MGILRKVVLLDMAIYPYRTKSIRSSSGRRKEDIVQRMASDKNITLSGLLIKPNDNDDSADDDAKNIRQ